jgi:PTS system fructose-specific IIC component
LCGNLASRPWDLLLESNVWRYSILLSHADPLLTLAVILVAGLAGGFLARLVHLPVMTGQILAGILIGRSGLNLFGPETIDGLEPITLFALSLITVAVGAHMNVRRLRNAVKRLTYLLIAELTISPLIVFLSIYFVGKYSWVMALLLAALAISTAPATIIALVKESRAKGIFVKTLIAAVALNNMACVLAFEAARVIAQNELSGDAPHTFQQLLFSPLWQLISAGLVGGFLGWVFLKITRRVIRSDTLATASFIAILLTTGIATYLNVSSLLSCMFFGFTLVNLAPGKERVVDEAFANFEPAILAAFFTLAGVELDYRYIIPAGFVALAMFAGRILGKMVAANLAMRLANATKKVRRYLGVSLLPQAGLAVGLVLLVQEDPTMVEIRDLFLAITLTVIMLNEIFGPILTRMALIRSGDFGKDRARLIDFIHEENITTNLKATNMKDAIEELAGLLIDSNHLEFEAAELIPSIERHEAEMDTCVGDGLAFPHGELADTEEQVVGAMGISRKGISTSDAPDGLPVHCIILLATPQAKRDRYLEVVAALTRAISFDRNIQFELFHAKSPAHAYEALHAEQAEDFNYFLDEFGEGPRLCLLQ